MPAALVSRDRLLSLVAPPGDAEPRVTLICAPAGSGKTTLLADWARTRPGLPEAAVAWATLTPDDNEPRVLWSVILGALERSGAWPGDGTASPLPTPPPGGPDAAFLAAFHAALAAATRTPVVLVLDDAHHVTGLPALHGLDQLLRSPPPHLRVVLSARAEPAVSLPRLRLEGAVLEIDATRLGFTAGEAADLLRRHRIRLSGPAVESLLELTEGWAAGLRLAALSADDADDADEERLTAFAGDRRAVADYLAREVLAGHEPDVRRFLQDTAVSEWLTADLAHALSGRDDAGALLDRLERSNSLVTQPDPGWYRCHPLLRQYLASELARERREDARRLHRRAAVWFESHRDSLAAVEHAAEAEDAPLLSDLLHDHGLRLVTSGAGPRLRRALRRAGGVAAGCPAAAVVGAAAAVDARDPAGADRYLAAAQPGAGRDAPGPDGSSLVTMRAVAALQRAVFESDPGTVRRLLETPLPESGVPDADLLARVQRGHAGYWLGRLDDAEDDLQGALAVARADDRAWTTLRCLSLLAEVALARCDLSLAANRAAAALLFADEHGLGAAAPAASARVTQGWVAFQAMDDATAERLASQSQPPDAADGDAEPTQVLSVRLLALFARYSLVPDSAPVVADVRDLWGRPWPRHVQPQLVALTHLIEQRMDLEIGATPWAVETATRAAGHLGETGDVLVMRAVVEARRGRLRDARYVLAPVLSGEVAVLTPLATVAAWLWEARLAGRAGEAGRAAAAVARAVSTAAPLGLIRPLVHGGREIGDLLSRAAGSFGHDEPFVELARSRMRATAGLGGVALTTRELELLTELPSMRTAEEIAESMVLSVNTVKTHIRGIYRKLGVTNRRDAVVTARQCGLL